MTCPFLFGIGEAVKGSEYRILFYGIFGETEYLQKENNMIS